MFSTKQNSHQHLQINTSIRLIPMLQKIVCLILITSTVHLKNSDCLLRYGNKKNNAFVILSQTFSLD